jgi:hypothetical protein
MQQKTGRTGITNENDSEILGYIAMQRKTGIHLVLSMKMAQFSW